MLNFFKQLMLVALLWSSIQAASDQEQKNTIKLYIDADNTNAKSSTQSIYRGILTALSETNNKLCGKPVEVIIKDNRGSSLRSKEIVDTYLNSKDALVIFAGLHSPPLLANQTYVNENEVIYLIPWAAAKNLTRNSGKNSIFRLSLDDATSGAFLVDYAIGMKKYKKPYLALEKTGWGESNQKTINEALEKYNIQAVGTTWFSWNLKTPQAKDILFKIKESGADVILLVADNREGITLLNALLELPEPYPAIVSHWGITGGGFEKAITADKRKKVDLKFIQTKFSFNNNDHKDAKKVFAEAQKLFPEIKNTKDIESPDGFIHAFDITKLLIAACNQIKLTDDIKQDRRNLKIALEDIQNKVKGLIKTYDKPFSKYDETQNPNGHEALNKNDYVMAQFGEDDSIIIIENSTNKE